MVDRISRLSDELLCHILSFLPTQQAVATSVLSKRWNPLWTSVPVLDYDDEIYLRNNRPSFSFERFVHATILARDAHQPIRTFRLKYRVPDNPPNTLFRYSNADVNLWVNTAVRRGIENLDIELISRKGTGLSCCILRCKTLVVLKLARLTLNSFSSVELPSLKSLHLVEVEFVEPQDFMKILYGSPRLEHLKTDELVYVDEAFFREEGFKCLPKLVRADIHFLGVFRINILLKAICNVEFLSTKQYQVDDGVPEFPHLRHLAIFLIVENWHWVLLMLKNCPKLQSLELDLSATYQDENALPYPHFVVPECLKSHFTKCHLKHYRGTTGHLQFAKYIMENATSLASMTIHSVSSPLQQLEELKDLALCSRKSASCQLSFSFE